MRALSERAAAVLTHRKLPFLAAGLAITLTLPCLGVGLMADDYFHRAVFERPAGLGDLFDEPLAGLYTFANGDPERAASSADLGLLPWSMRPELRLSFWRPLSAATHWIDYVLWPESPAFMHLHSLVWFGLGVLLISKFYRRVMPVGITAGLAAVLFAVDDAHALPAGWLANRNVLVALVFGAATLLAHDRWRRGDGRHWCLLSSVSLGLALLAKEDAVSICGYVLAYALFVEKTRARHRMLSLLPAVLVTAMWRYLYISAGFGASASSSYIDPLVSPVAYLQALVARAPILLQGLWIAAPSDAYTLGPQELKILLTFSACLLMVPLAVLLYALVRRCSRARFWCAGMFLALLPAAAAGPQDRLLMFAGIGAMGLVSQLLTGIGRGDLFSTATALSRQGTQLAYRVLIFCHLMVAPLLLPGAILGFSAVNDLLQDVIEDDLLSQGDLAGRTVVLVNSNSYPVGTYLFIIRALNGQPLPAHVRSFGPATMAAVPTRITRIDDFTIAARPKGGYRWSLFRSEAHAFELGEIVELSGCSIEISKLSEEGWPSEVTYTFDRPLEDPSFVWFRAKGTGYVALRPPEVGQTVVVEAW